MSDSCTERWGGGGEGGAGGGGSSSSDQNPPRNAGKYLGFKKKTWK